jgi:hypothetical protein
MPVVIFMIDALSSSMITLLLGSYAHTQNESFLIQVCKARFHWAQIIEHVTVKHGYQMPEDSKQNVCYSAEALNMWSFEPVLQST